VRPAAALTEALAGARELIAGLNTELVEVKFPEASLVGEAFSVTQRAEAYETHRRLGLFPSRAAEYGDDVRRHLESAADIDIAQYLHAQRDRATIRAGFRRLFEEVDILLGPANPIAPPGLDAVGAPFRSVVMPFMVPQDLAGLPAVVVRAGFDVDGLPISIQLTGPAGADHRVLALARAFHEATAELQSRWPALPPA
jgi:aspartyl-tRNA(Asn)/glutamyl-tRNA(Gln) amidotransferase subunit A